MFEAQTEDLLRELLKFTTDNEIAWQDNFQSDKDWRNGGLVFSTVVGKYEYQLRFGLYDNPVKTLKNELLVRTHSQQLAVIARNEKNKSKNHSNAPHVTITKFSGVQEALINGIVIAVLSKSTNGEDIPLSAETHLRDAINELEKHRQKLRSCQA